MDAASGRAIELYHGAPLERVNSRAIVIPRINERTRYHLASDVFVSRYGVTGFLLGDQKPGQRHITYTDQEWVGTECNEDSIPWEGRDDPIRRSHFLGTDTGFGMFRYFVLPPNVKDFFAQDEYLGDPMIDKYLRGSLPKYYDELPADPIRIREEEGMTRLIADIVNTAVPEHRLDAEYKGLSNWDQFGARSYLSFHRWEFLRDMIEEGEVSLSKGLANLDKVIDMHDRAKIVTVRLALPSTNLTVIDIPKVNT